MQSVVISNNFTRLKYLGILSVITILVIPAYADPVIKTTSGGTINVGFTTDPAIPHPGDQTLLKINFINKQTQANQVHVDYNVTVTQGSDRVFSTGILHTAEGVISIPFQFQKNGTYMISVEVDGLVFQPIPPETADFDVTIGSTGGNDVTPPGTIQIPNWVRNNAKWWSEGTIDDPTFAAGIQYLIQQHIIKIPPTQSGQGDTGVKIPMWVKNNAGFWSRGEIDDVTFVNGIQWLISNGIIHV